MNTGHEPGTTNFIENIPVPVTRALLERGQQRFNINCSPCHGAQGDGKGITVRVGAMPPTPKNLHDKLYVEMKDGEIFSTISNGKGIDGAVPRECAGGGSLGHHRLPARAAIEPVGNH